MTKAANLAAAANSTAGNITAAKVQNGGVTTNALAWVNFNGTTSPGTIRSSYNVGSVTKNGTGDYTLNFTNALSDANYAAVLGGINAISTGSGGGRFINGPYGTQSTSQYRLTTIQSGVGAVDFEYASVAIFGN